MRDKLAAGGYGGVGEIDIQHGSFDLSHDSESESFLKIYDLLEADGLAVHFQAALNQDPSLSEQLQRVISSRPGLDFVWFGHVLGAEFLALLNLYGETFLHSETVLSSQNLLVRSMIASDSSPGRFRQSGLCLPSLRKLWPSYGTSQATAVGAAGGGGRRPGSR